jgi:hypothetical protein
MERESLELTRSIFITVYVSLHLVHHIAEAISLRESLCHLPSNYPGDKCMSYIIHQYNNFQIKRGNNSPISRAQPSTNIPSVLTIRRTSLIALYLRGLPLLLLLTSQTSTCPIRRAETPPDITCIFAVCGAGFEA